MADDMQKWEYRVQAVGSFWSGVKDLELETLLNEWGEQGWEVVAVRPLEASSKAQVIAKRPLTREAQRLRSMPRKYV
jgi:hypothetical protein